jgi:hypothetical protein
MPVESVNVQDYPHGLRRLDAVLTTGRMVMLEIQENGVLVFWNGNADPVTPARFLDVLNPQAEDDVLVVQKQKGDEHEVMVSPEIRGRNLVSHIGALSGVHLIRINKVGTSVIWDGYEGKRTPDISVLADDWEGATEIVSKFGATDVEEELPGLIDSIGRSDL